MSKQNIPLPIKIAVWERCRHPADPRIAQCYTCYKCVRYPSPLIRYLIDNYSTFAINNTHLPYQIYGVGEYGHIFPESFGGQVSVNNLVIQCKDCNVRLGAHEMPMDTQDVVMISTDANINSHLMDVDQCEQCMYIKKNGEQCKNRPRPGHSYCHIHAIS